ncbi:MAG: SUMF1/EgtB/PvdO family nonheme iron enzyme [Acidobacteria bacterium]|nr:SUMF1/EgtB/PvdO family nonheme iron enzyme [Acidobacteriota bacterium]MBV9477430.1 SUMF1/EgtB/PvdO family nonheme iron enzyme [Acidobacteriota bacterium]
MRHHAFPDGVTREGLIDWYRATRRRTRALFDLIQPDAYYDRPIALRNPVVFYEGHLPAFAVNTLIKLALKRDGIDERLETLFARGIDPEDEAAVKNPTDLWPSRDDVQAYGARADAMIEDALGNATLERDDVPELRGGEAVFTVLEHELMHQETLLYMLHNLPYAKKRTTSAPDVDTRAAAPQQRIAIPAGRATLGAARDSAFGWDNEFARITVDVDAFSIDARNVTNGDYLEFMHATGANAPHFWMRGDNGEWLWRGLLAPVPLPLDAPVYATHDEAAAYARWKGARLPTEAEYHRAAYGSPDGDERAQPWGDDAPDATRGNFDFASYEPLAAGAHPRGASAWGVLDLVGNGWEWTSTTFDAFPGFQAMPSYLPYSTDFFDGAHYVMKGASPVTARELVRRSFRNWFRPNYPFVYATFRCVY